ncbi:MAG: hypothetical protein R3E82_09850 [Pseudomonadales bacterium]|nr:hypothetical protein [Pseudomonadales bacterium]
MKTVAGTLSPAVRPSHGKPRGRGLCLILALTLSGFTLGHEPRPVHGCVAPQRPPDDQNDARWESYLRAVDGFRACINEFAEVNRQASRSHNEAANDAVAAWNGFVKDQLNVPEDFPWPPE